LLEISDVGIIIFSDQFLDEGIEGIEIFEIIVCDIVDHDQCGRCYVLICEIQFLSHHPFHPHEVGLEEAVRGVMRSGLELGVIEFQCDQSSEIA
jgi:hypothetical protein